MSAATRMNLDIRRLAAVCALAVAVSLCLLGCNQKRATAVRRLNAGLKLQQTGQTDRAMEKFERAAEIDTSFAKPYFMLGQLHQIEFSSPGKAEEDYRKALQRDPDNPKYAYHLGSVLAKQGYHREAVKYFEQATQKRKNYAKAWYRLGESETARGNQSAAISAYMKSIRANPRMKIGEDGVGGVAYNALGNLYLEYGFFDKALKVFDNGIENNSDNARLYHGRGVAQLQLGEGGGGTERLEAAVASFKQAIERRKDYGSAYFNMAAAHRALGQPDDAIEALNTFMDTGGSGQSQARMSAARGLIQEIEKAQNSKAKD
jgi:tetratricopeptide (TPR) repeat protein